MAFLSPSQQCQGIKEIENTDPNQWLGLILSASAIGFLKERALILLCWLSILDGINSGSWYHCLPIGTYHWLGEGGCIAAVCEVVYYTEVRPGLSGKKMKWHFSKQRWEWSDGCVMLRKKIKSQVKSWEREIRNRWYNTDTTAKQVAMVWACAAKRRHWLGEEMYGIWGGGL